MLDESQPSMILTLVDPMFQAIISNNILKDKVATVNNNPYLNFSTRISHLIDLLIRKFSLLIMITFG